MSDQNHSIARRKFLQISGTGLAALASRRFWPEWQAGQELTTRAKLRKAVVIRSSSLEVSLDPKDGLPVEYRLLPGKATLRGEDFGAPIQATICDVPAWKFSPVSLSVAEVKAKPAQADFSFSAMMDGKPAVTFVVRYEVVGATLHVTLEDVHEFAGFELIEVSLPRLATVREEDGPAWLAHGNEAGSFAMLNEARPGALPPNTFWGEVNASLPVVVVGTNHLLCVQETTAFMDCTLLSVAGDDGHRRASLGTIQNYRVNGSLCFDMNTGSGTPKNCGNSHTPNLPIGQKSALRLDFLAAATGDGSKDWLDAAKLVRSRMPPIPTHYYDNKFIYGIRCDEPRFPAPTATFEQSEQIVREVAALTDGAPQIVHLWGWQYRGKDTGYPAVAEVNPRIGGMDGLMRVLAAGPKYNARVTFSDNYDDAYKSSPAWDPAIIARRPDGDLWLSRNWTGEDSYVIGLAKFMEGPGPERVRFTCQHYGLSETIHVDVLSYFPIRNDWDSAHPASGIRNLFDGRYKVLEDFKRQGIDVSSEAMRYAFIGKVSMFWHITGTKACPFGGKPIPFQPLVYRKSATWGEASTTGTFAERMLNVLFYNGCGHPIIRNDMDRRDITDMFFLMMLPWFKVHALNIESFHREGDRTIMNLEGNAQINLDWAAKTYAVTMNGVEIARDLATTCPLDDGRMAFYSFTEKELSAPLPKSWDAKNVKAFALSIQKPEEFPVKVDGGNISVSVPARRPVLVYRDGAAAASRLLGKT
jgi:hypothetical protein